MLKSNSLTDYDQYYTVTVLITNDQYYTVTLRQLLQTQDSDHLLQTSFFTTELCVWGDVFLTHLDAEGTGALTEHQHVISIDQLFDLRSHLLATRVILDGGHDDHNRPRINIPRSSASWVDGWFNIKLYLNKNSWYDIRYTLNKTRIAPVIITSSSRGGRWMTLRPPRTLLHKTQTSLTRAPDWNQTWLTVTHVLSVIAVSNLQSKTNL